MSWFRIFIDYFAIFVLPLMIVGLPIYGLVRGVKVYEEFVEGAKEGFRVAVMIIPYLVAILFAIGMFRASGAMDFLVETLEPVLGVLGFPPEMLPMAIIRPLDRLRLRRCGRRNDHRIRRRFNSGQDGGGHVRLHRNHVLRHRRVFRGHQRQENPTRRTRRADR